MELNDLETLKVVQERIAEKVYSFRDWSSFITWIKGITAAKFKAFILQCLDDVVAEGDTKKTDLLEIKTLIEG